MKAMFWMLLVAAVGGCVYFTNYAHMSGSMNMGARIGSAVVALGALVGLLFTRGKQSA